MHNFCSVHPKLSLKNISFWHSYAKMGKVMCIKVQKSMENHHHLNIIARNRLFIRIFYGCILEYYGGVNIFFY